MFSNALFAILISTLCSFIAFTNLLLLADNVRDGDGYLLQCFPVFRRN
jgi:hypothetical protein